MKRVLIGAVICCLLLGVAGCSNQGDKGKSENSEKVDVEESETDLVEESIDKDKKEDGINISDDLATQEKMEEDIGVNLPDGFKQLSDSELKSVPDLDDLSKIELDIKQEIGINEVIVSIYGNYEKNLSSALIEDYIVTDINKRIIISMLYSEIDSIKQWSVYKIVDVDTEQYYFMEEKFKDLYEIYDYKTGEKIIDAVNPPENVDADAIEETDDAAKTWYVSELELSGELIVDSTVSEMIVGYDYIKDIVIEVDESKKEIDIVVQVTSSIDAETAQMVGEDVARYLAAQASWATNSYRNYKAPGSNDLGSLYGQYDLLIYVDDGNHNFDIYGAKVTSSNSITWR